ncbi:hypothetical protein GGI43DRAFT_385486 [Trichoderma evansii]
MSSSATAGVARVSPATPLAKRQNCETFQYDAGSVHLGSWCLVGVVPSRLIERQTGIGISGEGCLPQAPFATENGDHHATGLCSINAQGISSASGFTGAFGDNFRCGSFSSFSNLDSIQVNGGDDSTMNIIYNFSDGNSYNAQCTGEGLDFCEGGNIGEPISGGLLNCQLPPETISINGCDECCSDAIQGC